MLSIAVLPAFPNTIVVFDDGANVAVPSGTACGGLEVQLAPSFQLLVGGSKDQVASPACALTAPRHTPAISPARILRRPQHIPRMTSPPRDRIDGLTLPAPATDGLDQEEMS